MIVLIKYVLPSLPIHFKQGTSILILTWNPVGVSVLYFIVRSFSMPIPCLWYHVGHVIQKLEE